VRLVVEEFYALSLRFCLGVGRKRLRSRVGIVYETATSQFSSEERRRDRQEAESIVVEGARLRRQLHIVLLVTVVEPDVRP
jgi:hypothetical protein